MPHKDTFRPWAPSCRAPGLIAAGCAVAPVRAVAPLFRGPYGAIAEVRPALDGAMAPKKRPGRVFQSPALQSPEAAA